MGTTASQLDKGMLSEYQVSVKSAVKMKVNEGTDSTATLFCHKRKKALKD